MAKPYRIIIVGAGPAGTALATSLAQQPPSSSSSTGPIQITVLERRPTVQTLGGAVNLTPLALRYLDSLGVGERLRPLAAKVSAIELVAYRTGGLLGRLWDGADAVRVQRQVLVETMLETVSGRPETPVEVIFGAKIRAIEEEGTADGEGCVRVVFERTVGEQTEQETLEADLLVGCDGIHSQVRCLVVDPEREKIYTGRCVAYAHADVPSDVSAWRRPDGKPIVTDTTLVSDGPRAMLLTYFNPAHDQMYCAAIMPMKETSDAREGWTVRGEDKAGLKRDIKQMFASGKVEALSQILDSCKEWYLFPVHILPPGGIWSRGRALLIGDAAHAMPPQGESTGLALEDGVLLAHVLSRRATRSVPRLFEDYETLRRPVVDSAYKQTVQRWNRSLEMPTWVPAVVVEYIIWMVVKVLSFRQKDHFDRDVRQLELPA